MTRTTALLLSALILPLAARAQSTPPVSSQTTEQPAKPTSTLEDDPQFKRLSPEQQELVRKMMGGVDNAIAADRNAPANPDDLKPRPAVPSVPGPAKTATANNVPPANTPAPAGCTALPVKKPKFHIPKSVQDAINKGAKNIGGKTGVDLDPNAPAQTVKDAQKNIPCPPAPTIPAAKPAHQ